MGLIERLRRRIEHVVSVIDVEFPERPFDDVLQRAIRARNHYERNSLGLAPCMVVLGRTPDSLQQPTGPEHL